MATQNERALGQFICSAEWIKEKKFDTGRSFTVAIANAHNALGLIGYEVNGVVILDNDRHSVVLSKHMRVDSGWGGPFPAQITEFDRIMEMDWGAFSKFCREHDNFTGLSPDFNEKQPLTPPSRPISLPIFPDSAKDAECPYEFPLVMRNDIEDFIAQHRRHNDYMAKSYLAWDIKVRKLDMSGHHENCKIDPAYDEKWDELVKDDGDSIWEQACSNGLMHYLDGEYSTYSGDDAGNYKFHLEGRSSGWLCLTSWNGQNNGKDLSFTDLHDVQEFVRSLPDDDLIRLYKLVCCLDQDLKNPADELRYQVASLRECQEDLWRNEASPK